MASTRSILLFIVALVLLSFALSIFSLVHVTTPKAPPPPAQRDMDRAEDSLNKLDTPQWRRRARRFPSPLN